MSHRSLYFANNVWSRFSIKTCGGLVKNMQIKELDKNHIDKFLDFFMEYFVSREKFHILCGIPGSRKASDEYRDIYKNRIENYSDTYKFVVCCQENEKTEDFNIVGYSGIKLLTKDFINDDITQFKTEEVKKYFDLDFLLHELSPTPNLLKPLPKFYDDQGLAILPEYSGCGIAAELIFTRRKMSTAHDVPMGGAWVSNFISAKAAWKAGYKTEREIEPEDLFKKLGVDVKKAPMIAKYVIHTKLEEKYMECSIREYMASIAASKNDLTVKNKDD